MKLKIHPAWGLLLGLALLPLMPTNQSLWLDEGDTAAYALQPDFSSWRQHLNQDVAADCQMPLAMFCAWVTGQTLGTQEWQLRAINIIWGALALLGLYRAGKKIQLPWLPLLLAIQPYFWFYSNEARPYALQIACGAWLFAGFAEFIALKGTGESWAWLISVAAFFLCLATLLAPLPIVVVVLVGSAIAKMCRWKISRKAVLILLGGAAANIPIALYYISTLARGAKGAQLWHVDLKFFGYVIYEFTGMTGLGLAIEKIREIARAPHLYATLMQYAVQFILPAACFLVLLLVLVLGLRKPRANSFHQPRSSRRKEAPSVSGEESQSLLTSAATVEELTARSASEKSQPGLTAGIIGVLGIIFLVFIVVGICIQKAFWARHLAPVFPFYVALLGIAISRVRESRNRFAEFLPCLLIGLLFFSALNLRFAARHRKEDYRTAAQIARHALDEKKSVWWVAGILPAQYYHLDYALAGPEPGKVFCPQSGEIQNLPAPDVIIFSKPDIFDDRGIIQDLIQRNNYHPAETLKSFVIWTK